MNTQRLHEVLTAILTELGNMSPRAIDVELGINRGQSNPRTLTLALATYTKARTDRRFPKEKPAIDVVAQHSEGSSKIGEADVVFHVGEKELLIRVALKVPPSVGAFLAIPRFKVEPKLLPTLSEGQRDLIAALAVVERGEGSALLSAHLNGWLKEQLAEVLSGQSAKDVRLRELLVSHGLFPDTLLMQLNELK